MNKNRFLFRLLVCLVLSAVLLTGMIGCTKDTLGEQQSTQGDNSANDGKIRIVNNGKSEYTVVYPKNASTAVKDAMQRYIAAIADATGVTLKSKTDEIKRGGVYDSAAKEILFGRTGYDQTAEALEGLEDDQFTIKAIGNKIVFASPKDANLDAAVTYFCENLLNANVTTEASGKKTLCLQEYTSEHNAESVVAMIGDRPISDYVIVYEKERAGYDEVATLLQSTIEQTMGVKLNVYADTLTNEVEAEILVGKTNRSVSSEIYTQKSPKLMTYEVVLKNDKLQIVSGGPYSARACVESLRFNLSKLVADGDYLATDLALDSAELATGAEARIMSYNVLAAKWGEDLEDATDGLENTPPVEQRAEIFASLLVKYKPDVVGLQEADKKWILRLPYYIELLKSDYNLEYTWEFEDFQGYETSTSILYRSDKYTLVESDAEAFSYWNPASYGYHMRMMEWVRLKEKTNASNEFIVLNTHWARNAETDYVEICVNSEIDKVNELKSKGVPIVCTGDFNNKTGADEYTKLLTDTGLVDTVKAATTANCLVTKGGGCGKMGSIRGENGEYIDHILVTSDCTTKRYETIKGNYAYWLSDHSPHIADLVIN